MSISYQSDVIASDTHCAISPYLIIQQLFQSPRFDGSDGGGEAEDGRRPSVALIWCLGGALFTRGAMTPKPPLSLSHFGYTLCTLEAQNCWTEVDGYSDISYISMGMKILLTLREGNPFAVANCLSKWHQFNHKPLCRDHFAGAVHLRRLLSLFYLKFTPL